MALLRPIPVDYRRLTYSAAGNLLVAEMSDFGRGFEFGRVWDDACDVGFTVIGRTGREVVYALDREQMRDGELVAWRFKPAKRSEEFLPEVVIFND